MKKALLKKEIAKSHNGFLKTLQDDGSGDDDGNLLGLWLS